MSVRPQPVPQRDLRFVEGLYCANRVQPHSPLLITVVEVDLDTRHELSILRLCCECNGDVSAIMVSGARNRAPLRPAKSELSIARTFRFANVFGRG
jgi:hypothetical protein